MGKKQDAYRFGKLAEYVVMAYLTLKFYRILAYRLRTPVGEIDIVARRWNTLVAVEVKGRKSKALTEIVSSMQQQRINRAMEFFLKTQPSLQQCDIRCDLIFWSPYRWPSHIKSAWEANHYRHTKPT